MPCKQEDYLPPDKRKTPKISSDFIARRQPVRRSRVLHEFISSQLALVSKENIDKVAHWLGSQLKQFGYNDSASYHEYTEAGYELKNVICHKQGTSSKILLFCAHYDTILMRDFEDVESRAPGADDNASGVSVLLEMSRIISKIDFE